MTDGWAVPIVMYHDIGRPVGHARWPELYVHAVRAAGYLGAMTTRYGLARPRELYTLQRVRVNGSDGSGGFASKIEAIRAY